MKHNKLTPAQEELLAKLTEECGEVSQMVGKTLVHGWDNFHPRMPEEGTNRERLEKELGGLIAVMWILSDGGHLNEANIKAAAFDKKATIWKYLYEQESNVNTGEGTAH